jgi:hypothetical protein
MSLVCRTMRFAACRLVFLLVGMLSMTRARGDDDWPMVRIEEMSDETSSLFKAGHPGQYRVVETKLAPAEYLHLQIPDEWKINAERSEKNAVGKSWPNVYIMLDRPGSPPLPDGTFRDLDPVMLVWLRPHRPTDDDTSETGDYKKVKSVDIESKLGRGSYTLFVDTNWKSGGLNYAHVHYIAKGTFAIPGLAYIFEIYLDEPDGKILDAALGVIRDGISIVYEK